MYRDRDAPPPPFRMTRPSHLKPGNHSHQPIIHTTVPIRAHHYPPTDGFVGNGPPLPKRGRGGEYQQVQGSYRNNYNGRPPPRGGGGWNGHGADRSWNPQTFRPPNPHHGPRHSQPFSNFNRGRDSARMGDFRPRFRPYQGHGGGHFQDHGKDSPWMTPELLKLIQEKEELWKICSETGSEDDHRNFKIKRFEVNMAVNDAKLLYNQKNPQLGNSYNHVFRRTVKNTQFYCEPCDKDFISEDQLEEHKTEHITCKLDGCTYTAHVKLVMKHIEIQHSTNLFQRIKGYNTPEEIENWKTERKKNFPTPENIARKKEEVAERKARGESLTAKEDFPGIEVFRHKIVPEERMRRQNQRGGYQSEGDEDSLPVFRLRPEAIRFMGFNSSPAIRLHNFYTDVTLSSSGTLTASACETWVNQSTEGAIEFNKPHENFEDATDKEFNITDDEEDNMMEVQQISTSDKVVESQSSECYIEAVNPVNPCLISEQKTKTSDTVITESDNHSSRGVGSVGLVSYDSDPGSDVEEDGEIKSDDEKSKLALFKPALVASRGVDPPLSSDDEAPDEVPIILTKEPDIPQINNGADIDKKIRFQDGNSKDIPDCHISKDTASGGQKSSGVSNNCRKVKNRTSKPQTHVQRAERVRRKYTLLQRLLAPDIRKEKNMVLQVCRFLVDRNFLDPVKINSDTNVTNSPPIITPGEELAVPSTSSDIEHNKNDKTNMNEDCH